MSFVSIGRLLISAGLGLTVLGGLIWLIGRTGFNGLPGDIRYNRGHFTFFFPIVTSIVLSVVLSIILNVIARMRR